MNTAQRLVIIAIALLVPAIPICGMLALRNSSLLPRRVVLMRCPFNQPVRRWCNDQLIKTNMAPEVCKRFEKKVAPLEQELDEIRATQAAFGGDFVRCIMELHNLRNILAHLENREKQMNTSNGSVSTTTGLCTILRDEKDDILRQIHVLQKHEECYTKKNESYKSRCHDLQEKIDAYRLLYIGKK